VGEIPPPRTDGRGPLQRYDRLVLVVVDALRYDFVAWQPPGTGDPPAPPYVNRLASVHDALAVARPDGSRPAALYRFEVPPTPSYSVLRPCLLRFRRPSSPAGARPTRPQRRYSG